MKFIAFIEYLIEFVYFFNLIDVKLIFRLQKFCKLHLKKKRKDQQKKERIYKRKKGSTIVFNRITLNIKGTMEKIRYLREYFM